MFNDRKDLYEAIEKERESKLLVYITGDRVGMETQINSEALNYLTDHLDKFDLPKKISLLLYTRGGNTLAAWSLTNLIRQFCDEFEVIIPLNAQSSGTLISLGADKIIMTKQATLGPIDPSLNGALNPQDPRFPTNPGARVPVSVESIQGYFGFAKDHLKVNSPESLSNILIELSRQVHPLLLGAVNRSRTQIQMLAEKLLSKNMDDNEKISKIISFLCSDSGSHDYSIYRREARDELGLPIEKPSNEFYKTIKATFDDISKELDLRNPFNVNLLLGGQPNANYECRRALIESLDGGTDVYISEGTLTMNRQAVQQQPGMPPVNVDVVNDQRSFEGWRHE